MAVRINENIRNIRELKNYTQLHMANMLGITQAGYSKLENGRGNISFEKLEAIAVIFEMELQAVIQFDKNAYLSNISKEPYRTYNHCDKFYLNGLFSDKIVLLEKLLNKTDQELKTYKERFGIL